MHENPTSNNRISEVKVLLQDTIQNLESTLDALGSLDSLDSLQQSDIVAPSSSVLSGVNIFAVEGVSDYTIEEINQIVMYIRENYFRQLHINRDSSTLGVILYLSLAPIVERLYRAIKVRIQEEYPTIRRERLHNDIAALEFAIFLRNQANSGAGAWTLLTPEKNTPRAPNEFDSVNDPERFGLIDSVILPGVAGPPRQWRGLVSQIERRRS
tara:strand:- start:259 stop:894 length:636 start_codon:yes stop_codon:yes gene_type:complete